MISELYRFKINKHGFTLAEVLITLVIIGVVAALAISPLVNTYVESSTVAKVKKGLSILGQAKKLAEVQNGSIVGWDFGSGQTFESASKLWNYLKPNIAVAKDCGNSTECYQSDGVYLLNGNRHEYNYNTSSMFYKIVLADGSVMWFRTGNGSGQCSEQVGDINNICAAFYYDVNGDKKPNTVGRDIFVYYISADGAFPSVSDTCSKTAAGWGCTAYIIKNGNMKYLH